MSGMSAQHATTVSPPLRHRHRLCPSLRPSAHNARFTRTGIFLRGGGSGARNQGGLPQMPVPFSDRFPDHANPEQLLSGYATGDPEDGLDACLEDAFALCLWDVVEDILESR